MTTECTVLKTSIHTKKRTMTESGQTSILSYYGSRKHASLDSPADSAGTSKGKQRAEPAAEMDVKKEQQQQQQQTGKKRALDNNDDEDRITEDIAEDMAWDASQTPLANTHTVFEREYVSDTDSEEEEELQDVQEKMRKLRADIKLKVHRRLRSINARKQCANAQLSMIANEINGLGQGIAIARTDLEKQMLKSRRAQLLGQIGSVLAEFNPVYANSAAEDRDMVCAN